MRTLLKRGNKGFSIVSVMMAITITMIGVVAVLAILPVGYKALVKSRKRNKATAIVQRQLEEIKRLGVQEFYRVNNRPLTQAAAPYSDFYTQVFVDYVRRDVLDSDGDGSTEDFVPTASLNNMKRVIVRVHQADPIYGGASSTILLEESTFISGILPSVIDNIPPAVTVFVSPDPGSDVVTITVTSDELLGAPPTATVTQQSSTPISISDMAYTSYTGGTYYYEGTYTVISGASTDGTANVNVTAIDGNSNIGYASGTFEVDTVAPSISGVYSYNVLLSSADISWTVDEAGTYQIDYGISSPSLSVSGTEGVGSVVHTLTGLASGLTYYFDVTVSDSAGNSTTDDNGGSHYSFTTQTLTSLYVTLDTQVGADTDENYTPGSVVRVLITETQGASGLETLGSYISITGALTGVVVNQATITAGGSPGTYYYDWTNTSIVDAYTVYVYLTDGSIITNGQIIVDIVNVPVLISSIDTAVGADTDENYDPDSTVRITVLETSGLNGLEGLGSSITITNGGSVTVVDAALLTAGAADGEYYYDWTVSVEDTYNVAVTLNDGYTQDTASISVTIQAANIVLNGGISRRDRSSHDRIRLYALNESTDTVVITTMRVVWNKDTKIYRVKTDGTTRWNIGSPGLPSGSSFYLSSNITFNPGSNIYFVLYFFDNGPIEMDGSTTTVYLIDASDNEYAVGPISVP